MSRELLTNLAAALAAIDGGTGYITRAGEVIQLGGSVPDKPETDQLVIRMGAKEYRSTVNGNALDYATGATSYFVAGTEFQVIGVASQLHHDEPGERLSDLLEDIERALMLADTITAGGKKHTIQIVSADTASREDGANAETVTVTVRLSGPQAWQRS